MIKIGVITMCYNESMILPYFLKHYSYVDQIRVLFETDTTDNSRSILEAAPNVFIQDIHIEGGIVDETKVQIINQERHRMASEFDWIYVLDTDELIYPDNHEDPREFLARQKSDIIYAHMWQVYRHWSEQDLDPNQLPLPQRQHGDPDLYSQVEGKYRDKNANSIKPSIMKTGIKADLLPGNHRFYGTVDVGQEIFRGVHWQMADYKLAVERRMARKFRISNLNRNLRHGFQHFEITPEIIEVDCIQHNNDPKLPIYNIPKLDFLKYIALEINDECPLTNIHPECPRNHDRFANLPDYGQTTPEEMIKFVSLCFEHGFNGLITLHNYNDPMCTPELVAQMVNDYPWRVSLWTSGVLLDPIRDKDLITMCHDVMITDYPGVVKPTFEDFINVKHQSYPLDGRTSTPEKNFKAKVPRCTRPDWEIVLNIRGFVNMCCGDWKGEINIGNIKTEDPAVLLHRWNQWRKKINAGEFPPACEVCLARDTQIPMAGR